MAFGLSMALGAVEPFAAWNSLAEGKNWVGGFTAGGADGNLCIEDMLAVSPFSPV